MAILKPLRAAIALAQQWHCVCGPEDTAENDPISNGFTGSRGRHAADIYYIDGFTIRASDVRDNVPLTQSEYSVKVAS